MLGPNGDLGVELLELKGPSEQTLNRGPHRGFSVKLKHAVDQVRDYGHYLKDEANFPSILESIGYLPRYSRHAVVIGRNPRNADDLEVWARRQRELDVIVVTYDEILEAQTDQLTGPYNLRYGTSHFPI